MMNDDTDRARAPLEPKTAGNVAAVAAEHREHTMGDLLRHQRSRDGARRSQTQSEMDRRVRTRHCRSGTRWNESKTTSTAQRAGGEPVTPLYRMSIRSTSDCNRVMVQ